jgi:hypothetical protein
MSFAFDIEVATGVGKPDDAASAGAKPDQAVTAQRVNVDPKCEFALYRRPPAVGYIVGVRRLHAERLNCAEIASEPNRQNEGWPRIVTDK